MKPTVCKRAFTLVEMLLVIAIISILAAMAISNFSNASQDTRAVVARQQLAVMQEAVNHWANKEIGKVSTSGGTGKTVAQVMGAYNATADAQARFDLFKSYLDDATLESLSVDNSTGRITSQVMRDVGMYLNLPAWGGIPILKCNSFLDPFQPPVFAMQSRSSLRRAGFSLVEVLAAVAIVGILVFIAIPNVIQARRDAEEQFAIGRAEALNSSISNFIQANGRANAGTAWAGKSNSERYLLVRGYLAYAPNAISDYQPNGYAFTLPPSPDARVVISRDNGTATPDTINY